MKALLFTTVLLLFSCHSIQQLPFSGLVNIYVERIDDNLLNEYHCIFFRAQGHSALLLSGKTNSPECKQTIRVGQQYVIELTKLYAVKLGDLSWRLDAYDMYINEQLVFEKTKVVYSACNLNGLCITR